MKMNIAGQVYLHRKRKAEKIEKANQRARDKPKQSAEEKAAKIAACAISQAVKRRNRYQGYRRSLLNNPIMSPATIAGLISLNA